MERKKLAPNDDAVLRKFRKVERQKLIGLSERIGDRAIGVTDDGIRNACIRAMFDLCGRYTEEGTEEHRELWGRITEIFLVGKYAGQQDAEWSLRKSREAAGKVGGKMRHLQTSLLKNWASSAAKLERGSAKQIARRLARNIPEEYQDASDDPERLIYETLLREARSKVAASGEVPAVPAVKPAV